VASCDALHGGHHGFGQVHDCLHHRAAGVHDLREIGTATISIGAACGEFFHVMAGGKGRAIGRDYDRAHVSVVMNVVQRRVQLGDQTFRQAVARRRPVEREHGDVACALAQQDRRLRRWCAGRLGGRRLGGHSEISTRALMTT